MTEDSTGLIRVPTEVQCPESPRPESPKPEITASCDPAAQTVTVRGTGWTPGPHPYSEVTTEITGGVDEVLASANSVPDQNEGFEASVQGSFTAGKTLTVEAQAREGLKASTTVECPGSPGGGSGDGSDSSVIPPVGDVFSGLLAGRLPDTGGGWAILLIAGAIFIALGGLVFRLA